MGRGNRRPANDGDIKEIQKLKLENQKLRRQTAKLRKELSKIDIDRYSYLKDLIESQKNEDEDFTRDRELEDLKSKWECHTCGKDYLRLIIVPRLDGTRYFRKCPSCQFRTKLKLFTEDIEGLCE